MNWFQSMIIKLLKIAPARNKEIIIREPLSLQGNIMKNKIWYRGEPTELEQFFKINASNDVEKSRFWAAVPKGQVRKMHSGIVSTVIDRYKDMVTSDLDGIDILEEEGTNVLNDTWKLIEKDNNFTSVLEKAIQEVLITGDGAFKISTDEISQYPIISFHDAEDVSYNTKYGRIIEIKFYTNYKNGGKEYRLEETYGKGYIKYKLYDENGKEKPLKTIKETENLTDIKMASDFIMAEPFKIFPSAKWEDRGKALFDAKSDVLDALDEVISQWLDAVRLGRIKRYIPDDLIPRDANTGEIMPANPFDNDFIAVGSMVDEGGNSKIDISQPNILYDAYVNSYINFLDMVLQGVISPSTLGIDLKKTDNASSQREKEKITLHVRNKIIDKLTETIPNIVNITLKTYYLMKDGKAKEYEASVKFGEYASPDFDSTVETVTKARNAATMSIEKAVDEMYGDGMTEEEKKEEVARIKAEQGIAELQEPAINTEFEYEEMEEDTKNGGG